MPKRLAIITAAVAALLDVQPSLAWDTDEHALLADRAYQSVLNEVGFVAGDDAFVLLRDGARVEVPMLLWDGKPFEALCASMAADDEKRTRYHERGRTILDQLRALSAADLEALWRSHATGETRSAENSRLGVVANYFIHHYLALKCAGGAGADDGAAALQRALVYEAIAQGYLADAFSAGHMRLPDARFRRLTRGNLRAAHDRFGVLGLYVIDSRGRVWQSFGDHLLFWYGPTQRFALDACETSLREVLLAYFVASGGKLPAGLIEWADDVLEDASPARAVERWTAVDDGETFYSSVRMPTLLLLPVPVSASWSIRTDSVNAYGIRQRHHFPQLLDVEYHDPSLEDVHRRLMYPASSVPPWMIPDRLRAQEPEVLIRHDADVASVRYTQTTDIAPSYEGLLTAVGVGPVFDGTTDLGTSIGVGYGLTGESILFRKTSLELILNPRLGADRRTVLSVSAHGGTDLPGDIVDAYVVEAGYAWGLREPFTDSGVKLGVGLETATVPLGFTYAGITIRAKYQWYLMGPTVRAMLFELVLH